MAQLRHAIGEWNVTTVRYGEDGSVTGTMPGTYRFEWVVPDRVINGRSDIPELGSASGILFYVRDLEARQSPGIPAYNWGAQAKRVDCAFNHLTFDGLDVVSTPRGHPC